MYLTAKALVLREVRYKDADKILTVLTERDGKITAGARGALRRGSRISAASQILTCAEMTFFGNRGKWRLDEAEIIEQFMNVRLDIASLALGTYFAEVLETVSDEDRPNPALLQLALNSLYALDRGLYAPKHIKAVFELRIMCLSGFAPELSGCHICGKKCPVEPWFSLEGGAVHCLGCGSGNVGKSLPLCEASLLAMRYAALAPAKKIFSFSLDEDAAEKFYRICEEYLSLKLEHNFGALDYWKQVRE